MTKCCFVLETEQLIYTCDLHFQTFLELEELPTSAQVDASCLTDNKDSKFIEIERATAKWDEVSKMFSLVTK